jgi:hypothetical protein
MYVHYNSLIILPAKHSALLFKWGLPGASKLRFYIGTLMG